MTLIQLTHEVHQRALAMGMDLAPSDVALIIHLFFEGMIAAGPHPVNDALQAIADELMKVRDEV